MIRITLLFIIILSASCGSSTAQSVTSAPAPSIPTFNAAPPSAGIGSVRVLDLGTGDVTEHDENFSIATLAADQIAFRRVNATEALIGSQPGTLGAQSDEAYRVVQLASYYLSITEVTQAQWQAMRGTTPWSVLGPSSAVGAVLNDPALPAFGFTAKEADIALNTVNAGLVSYELDLPSAEEWECACRAGSADPYNWGSNASVATVALHAIVQETRPSIGAQLVAQRLPNAYGFFDMHGNTWELLRDRGPGALAIIRGGSWSSNLLNARAANRQFMDPDVPHAALGLRLILRDVL